MVTRPLASLKVSSHFVHYDRFEIFAHFGMIGDSRDAATSLNSAGWRVDG